MPVNAFKTMTSQVSEAKYLGCKGDYRCLDQVQLVSVASNQRSSKQEDPAIIAGSQGVLREFGERVNMRVGWSQIFMEKPWILGSWKAPASC